MNEFMLLIRNEIDHQTAWSPERHQQFLKSCENYIDKLNKDGRLKAESKPLGEKARSRSAGEEC
jgi:hypothetical protein